MLFLQQSYNYLYSEKTMTLNPFVIGLCTLKHIGPYEHVSICFAAIVPFFKLYLCADMSVSPPRVLNVELALLSITAAAMSEAMTRSLREEQGAAQIQIDTFP